MSPQTGKFVAGVVTCVALWAAVPAHAGQVLVVDGARTVRTQDPFVPARGGAELGRAPHSAHRAATAVAAGKKRHKRRGPTRGQKAVGRALSSALARHTVSRASYARYRRLYSRARKWRKRLRGARRRELGSVIATLEAIALRRALTGARMPALFLILQRNTQFWRLSPFPANRDRVQFAGSELLFEYYTGSGLQLQPLANFKKANLMHGACVKDTGEPCLKDGLRRLLAEMVATSTRRGGFRAWEYYFTFGGGRPPWISGMATATGIQAFGRASQLLGDPGLRRYAREAFRAFEVPPPTGVVTPGPLGGTHYLQYSFAPRLFVINAFLQSVIGLYDYDQITGDPTARRLWQRAEPEARAEVPHNDTGDWSTYSFGGRESTAEYHELLREFLASLCSRLHQATYCDTARRFRLYTTEPAQLELLGPESATEDAETRVRFSLSKLSAVQIVITRDGKLALDRTATFRRGEGSFAWTPRSVGTYTVRLAAKELRTGRGLRTRTEGEVESVP